MADAANTEPSANPARFSLAQPFDWSRLFFLLQALAGAAWWIMVFTVEGIRVSTLGGLNPGVLVWMDVPLFVVGSLLLAFGWRRFVWIVLPWILLVTVSLFAYSLITRTAGMGALLMIASAFCSTFSAFQLVLGRIPTEYLLHGPFAFCSAPPTDVHGNLRRTVKQLLVFWTLFLAVIPGIIVVVERRLEISLEGSMTLLVLGLVLLLLASALGIWSALTMSARGKGTPLPSAMPRKLVISGPYAFVRNPMAVAGITQGVAVGLILGSWLVVAYALVGSLLWNWLIRPAEEANLRENFGEEFTTYQQRVSCWVPKMRRISAKR
ncbi:isoprenylcysteine carboxylmethyltransferase family protein [Glutamicibacter sp. JC586]|uniref:methyltransferase family protein n=1 Tax=Glutamicibacter sp. JC586 TaxID=2590552 RepID=UPI001358421E|nr:methyltransferase [Glutamicibacter sp. JC586]